MDFEFGQDMPISAINLNMRRSNRLIFNIELAW